MLHLAVHEAAHVVVQGVVGDQVWWGSMLHLAVPTWGGLSFLFLSSPLPPHTNSHTPPPPFRLSVAAARPHPPPPHLPHHHHTHTPPPCALTSVCCSISPPPSHTHHHHHPYVCLLQQLAPPPHTHTHATALTSVCCSSSRVMSSSSCSCTGLLSLACLPLASACFSNRARNEGWAPRGGEGGEPKGVGRAVADSSLQN